MKASYDRKTDTLSFILKEGVTVAESDEGNPGVILDYDEREIWFQWRYWTLPNA